MFENSVIFVDLKNGYRMIGPKDDLSYFLSDHALTEADVRVLPMSEATAEELAERIGDELENANYHSMTSMASDFLGKLNPADFTEAQRVQVMRALADVLGRLV